MRTMFVKLFIWFWLAMVLSGLVAFLVWVFPLRSDFEARSHREQSRMLGQALTLYGSTAAAIFEREGRATSLEVGSPATAGGMRAYLFAADGAPLTGDVPPAVRDAVRKLLAQGGNETVAEKGAGVITVGVRSPRGAPFVAALGGIPDELPPPKPTRFPLIPPDFWFRIGISFVVGGLVCYGLAWHLTAPIRQLRTAAQRLAAGELAARVPIRAGARGDEVTDLGRDFNRMAERIEQLLTAQKQLVRDISHELRSPLARLNVALALVRRDAPGATAAELDRMEQEADRLNEMIGELLGLSLLESDGSDGRLGKETVDLAGLVAEVVGDADFEAAADGRHVRLTAAAPLAVEGGREVLRRALENVVRNGMRYTAEGTTVEVSLELHGSTHAAIRVRDHGPGVPEENLADIFRPFYRVAEARDRQSGGTGIGLAITERTITLHGGTVRAENARDGGLIVEIILPVGPDS